MHNNRLFETFRQLTSVYSPTFGEGEFCCLVKDKLTALGLDWEEDDAGAQIGGDCGNLYAWLPGALPGEPLLFSAHLDTVEPAKGKEAVLHPDGKITSRGDTILGADDVSGIAIILEALARLQETGTPHRAIELLFPVAEERYGLGSVIADYGKLRAREAYVLDLSGHIGEAANAAPTLLSFTATVQGRAAHAGFAPGDGIHAISAAARAIAAIPMGEPEPGVTCNIGVISGGEAGNIVPERCTVQGEIRSLSHSAALAWLERVRATFEQEARQLGAAVTFDHQCRITAYETPMDSAVVRRFQRACQGAGVPCDIHSTLGGSDNNHYAQHGIAGLVLACSMHEVHSTREYASLPELEQCVRLVMELMTAEV